MSSRREVRVLDVVFVVLIVIIGFLAFFIGFLVAPLIVMALAYLALVVLDRRHHDGRSQRREGDAEKRPGQSEVEG